MIATADSLSAESLDTLRARRSAGEPIKALAKETGLSWQKLWGLLQPARLRPAEKPKFQGGKGPLTERYRPIDLDAIFGQDEVVNVLKRFTANPYPAAFIFEGPTGTGKSSAALAFAAALGCDLAQKEWGGVTSIPSGEQTADTVRDIAQRMHLIPWHGSGWKVFIVNEADRMAKPAEMIWLDVLENLPDKTVVIFTTNRAFDMTDRFRDRCQRLTFTGQADKLRSQAEALAAAIWLKETGKVPVPAVLCGIVGRATVENYLSLRRVVQETAAELAKEPQ